jgi:hypothetical protein
LAAESCDVELYAPLAAMQSCGIRLASFRARTVNAPNGRALLSEQVAGESDR